MVVFFSQLKRLKKPSILNKPFRTFSSDCPMYILSNSGPFTLRKLTFSSVLTAFATNVFPQPGGPYSRMPENIILIKNFNLKYKF